MAVALGRNARRLRNARPAGRDRRRAGKPTQPAADRAGGRCRAGGLCLPRRARPGDRASLNESVSMAMLVVLKHIEMVACSAEGAALCQQAICPEALRLVP